MNQKVLITVESFTVSEKKEGTSTSFKLEGLALPFNTRSRNGFVYSTSSIKTTYKQLEGKPFLLNHNPEHVLGHVEKVWLDDDGMHYRADLDPQEEYWIQKMRRGDVSTVSIQSVVDTSQDENADVDIKELLELSAAPIPGFPMTSARPITEALRPKDARRLDPTRVRCGACGIYLDDKEALSEAGRCASCEKHDLPVVITEKGLMPWESLQEDGTVAGEPFAGYTDFDACVADNQDKDDPEAFCAWLHNQATGDWPGEGENAECNNNTQLDIGLEDDGMPKKLEDMDKKELLALAREQAKKLREQDDDTPPPGGDGDGGEGPDLEEIVAVLQQEIEAIKARLDALEKALKGDEEEPPQERHRGSRQPGTASGPTTVSTSAIMEALSGRKPDGSPENKIPPGGLTVEVTE